MNMKELAGDVVQSERRRIEREDQCYSTVRDLHRPCLCRTVGAHLS
jgi:hypothetical protein